jgi:hypothetical protein
MGLHLCVVLVWVGGVGCSVVSALSWVDVGFIYSIRALVIDKVNLLWGVLCVYVALWGARQLPS